MEYLEVKASITDRLKSLAGDMPVSFSAVRVGESWPDGYIHQAAIDDGFMVDLEGGARVFQV